MEAITPSDPWLVVDVLHQQLILYHKNTPQLQYRICTSANGVGEVKDSECTPRGWHIIRAKIGEGAAPNTVFIDRRPTGELFTEQLKQENPNRDWILTRILWLSGLEEGKNRLGNVDTMQRCVYIHGSPDSKPMGIPSSRGCINMRNRDIIDLYKRVPVGTKILIKEE